jgi:hypothetical protein
MKTPPSRSKVAEVTTTSPLASTQVQPIDSHTTRGTTKATKTVLATLVAAALSFVMIPSSIGFASGGGGGGGGGGTVAGKCGTVTSISASPVLLSASGTGYTASPLQIRGQVFNCSIYLQQYWIDFDEPTNTNATCKASFSLFNALLLSSGSSQSWTATTNTTPNGVATSAGCVGAHTVRAVLRSRTDGTVLHTVYVNYSISLK